MLKKIETKNFGGMSQGNQGMTESIICGKKVPRISIRDCFFMAAMARSCDVLSTVV
jgi:hypothetical protein